MPEAVYAQLQAELGDWRGYGTSVLEIGHRSPAYFELVKETEQRLRDIMGISDDYHVAFLHGGARTQASFLPLNFCGELKQADYAVTGLWSKIALDLAKPHCDAKAVVIVDKNAEHKVIPPVSEWHVREDSAYLHYTTNETVAGIQFQDVPDVGIPLIADMTSDILSYPVDVSQFGAIYAGTQKNMGIAGLAVCIAEKTFCERAALHKSLSPVFNVGEQASISSAYNTPPVFAIYMANLMLTWMKDQGGLDIIHANNLEKAAVLHAVIDEYPEFYQQSVDPAFRSVVNIAFRLPNETLEEAFLEDAKAANILNIRGHSSAGGIRVSLYNAMPVSGAKALADFMTAFAAKRA